MNGEPEREEDVDDDVRLSGERTDLAWSRSGLAVVVCLAAIAKRSLPELSTLDTAAVLVVALVVGGIAWAYSLFSTRIGARRALAGHGVADMRVLWLIAVGTAVLGVAAVVVALLPDR